MARGSKKFLDQLADSMAAGSPKGSGKTKGAGQNDIARSLMRLQADPGKAFGALNKLMDRLPEEQKQALTGNINNLFSGMGASNPNPANWASSFQNLNPMQQRGIGLQGMSNLAQFGLTPGNPGINPPGPPPVGINPPPKNMLDLSGGMSGTMGMAAPTPTLAQTVNTMGNTTPAAGTTGGLPAVPGTGAATGAGATATPAANSPTGENNSPTGTATANAAANTAGGMGVTGPSSANTTPLMPQTTPGSGATTNSLINTGALSAPGVGLDVVQNTVNNSSLLANNPITQSQMFQQQYNPMINMAGSVDIQNQIAGQPGRSIVGGQYGEGGLMGIAGQQQANAAALAGGTAAQEAIKGNIQHGLQGQQLMAGMDAAGRQQAVQQANAILGPALSGAATGFQAGLSGMTRMPQFMA